MNTLQAKARLVAAKLLTATNIPWDKVFKKTFQGSPSTGVYNLKTKEGGQAQVRVMGEADEEFLKEMSKKHGGNLMNGVPNIEFEIGGVNMALTWEEAYNLGFMLMKNAESAYYG